MHVRRTIVFPRVPRGLCNTDGLTNFAAYIRDNSSYHPSHFGWLSAEVFAKWLAHKLLDYQHIFIMAWMGSGTAFRTRLRFFAADEVESGERSGHDVKLTKGQSSSCLPVYDRHSFPTTRGGCRMVMHKPFVRTPRATVRSCRATTGSRDTHMSCCATLTLTLSTYAFTDVWQSRTSFSYPS
ncbi:hypothetical protein P153DRAFT_131490 [Dothidotthia symphoricarpi CBS 119687]|uniref:Uncharacterized protein n=1 Tax=Dothidotthia symphoricarpi CBS 119687 TaxID=1392245 RepID=A0A6A6A1H5_9PLEO|nr:uncharacterized protein P153DRAFT_131490 [Dothidotthia symphoricarpi CBS 119687]KAF2124411.1 hypothetical protein P153DRAFT_131490 [Dothidotthia symphoricarpi CBS 119687]